MSMLVLAGDPANDVEAFATAPVASPVADTNFPTSNLQTRIPSQPFRFGSLTANPTLTFDKNILDNGDMTGNSGGNLTIWTESNTGTGNVSYDATGGESGGAGMKLESGTGTASAYQTKNVRAGVKVNWTVALKGDGVVAVALRVLNEETGNYWTGAAWSSTPTDLATRTAATFATSSGSFTVESAPALRPDLQVMRLKVMIQVTTAAGTCYADNCYFWLSTDLLSVHYHNISPVISLELRRSTDNFGASDVLETTITSFPMCFFYAFGTMRDERYLRLTFTGTNAAATTLGGPQIMLGKVVLGQKLSLARMFNLPESYEYIDDQVRSGDVPIRTYRRMEFPRRVLTVDFNYDSAAAFIEARDALILRSRNGHYPLIIVPVSSETHVLYGRIEPVWSSTRVLADGTADYYEGSPFRLVELPGPSWIP